MIYSINNNNDKSLLTTGQIIGISIGSFLLLIFILIIIKNINNKRNRLSDSENGDEDNDVQDICDDINNTIAKHNNSNFVNHNDNSDVFNDNTLGRIERSVNDVYNNNISRMIANTSYASPLDLKNISKNSNTINKAEVPESNEEFKPTQRITRSKIRNRFLSNEENSNSFNKFDIYSNNETSNETSNDNSNVNNNGNSDGLYSNKGLTIEDLE